VWRAPREFASDGHRSYKCAADLRVFIALVFFSRRSTFNAFLGHCIRAEFVMVAGVPFVCRTKSTWEQYHYVGESKFKLDGVEPAGRCFISEGSSLHILFNGVSETREPQ
jgi:hypothetical protein